MRKYIFKQFCSFLLLFLLACNSSDEIIIETLIEVPFSIIVSDGGVARAAPPDAGSGGNGPNISGKSDVNELRIITFKRLKGTQDLFRYESLNDRIIECKEENGMRIAKGKISISPEFEYQTIALGYATSRNEQNMFDLNSPIDGLTSFEELKLILSQDTSTVGDQSFVKIGSPELFYGYCHPGDGNRIFSSDNTINLEGMLFRCMGLVNIMIDNIPMSTYSSFTLFTENMHTQSTLLDYADFKTPSGLVAEGDWKILETVELISSSRKVDFSCFMLAVETKMMIRAYDMNQQYKDYIIRYESVGDESNATGIISPVAENETLYIRRNKQYNVSGNYEDLNSL